MEKMNGAQVLVKSLKDLGVSHVFGYTGAAILPVFDALAENDIDIIVNSNEQSCAFSAAAYSRSSSKVGVCVVTSGPAITNTLTSVADAYGDSIPLIVIAGQVPEHKIGTDSFQHINVERIFEDVAKKVIRLSNSQDIESIVKDAYYLSQTGRPGPVVIDFPLDKQNRSHIYKNKDVNFFRRCHCEERHLSQSQCKQFFDLLINSKRPLLYIGGGLNSEKGSHAIRNFYNYFKIPVVNTLMAKGVINGNDELNMGMLGMFGTPYANMVIQENDFFFAMGARWDDRVAEKVGFAIESKIAYIDINPKKVHQIRIERAPDFSFIGDIADALKDLLKYAKENNISINITDWQMHVQNLKKTWPLAYNNNSNNIQSAHVMELLSKKLDDNMKIVTGVGNHQMLAAQYLNMHEPKSFLTSGSFGTMGFCLPSVVGAYMTNPKKKIIAIDGDGSLRMNLGELHTIVSQNLPVKILMLNNKSDGMVLNLQDISYGGKRVGTQRLKDIDFSQIAEKIGFDYSKRVIEKNELECALDELLSFSGSCFLEICTDKEEVLYPKVPPGKSYADMILGPYIKKKNIK